MRKAFPIFAVLMAIMLASWMLGCGEDENPCEIEVTIKSTTPADGGDITANGTLIIDFEGGAASDVTVNDNEAGNGAKVTWTATGLEGEVGKEVTLTIKWKYCSDTDEEKSGEKSIKLNVTEKDEIPPAINDSSPSDGATDLDPTTLSADGVTVNFSEPVTYKTGNIFFEFGEEGSEETLDWIIEPTTDKTGIVLSVKSGNDLPYETEITLKLNAITDLAGNPADLSVTFTTQAKE